MAQSREEKRQRQYRRQRERRKRYQAERRCITCGQPAVNKNYCEVHREWHRQYSRRRYRENAEARARHLEGSRRWFRRRYRCWRREHPRLCRWCLQPLSPKLGLKKYHPRCHVARNQAFAPLRHRDPEAHRRAALAYQRRNRAAGKCVTCGRKSDGHTQCSRCRKRSNARRRQRTETRERWHSS
jgi:hypothetical protein